MEDEEKYLSTEDGLDFVGSIADRLGMEFDREATRRETDRMYDLHIDAIVRIAKLDPIARKVSVRRLSQPECLCARFRPGAGPHLLRRAIGHLAAHLLDVDYRSEL